MPKKPHLRTKAGPLPETLTLDGNWKDAMKKSLAKKKPAGGWPVAPVVSARKGKGK